MNILIKGDNYLDNHRERLPWLTPTMSSRMPPQLSLLVIVALMFVSSPHYMAFVTVGAVVRALSFIHSFKPHTVKIMTWSGLRGGLSMALSLPAGETRTTILAVTYVVVVFSIIVQGLTLRPLVRRLYE